ncbi:MAG TPA: hypothetical protein VGX75_10570 [bacterium]|nr:hypothetical protein [bacterium]
MWPYLFGSGWPRDIALSAGLIAAIVFAIAVMLARREQPAGYPEAAADRIQTIWHAYEQGDLTEWEFARLITPRPAIPLRSNASPAGALPVRETVATHDAAAD